MKLRPPYKNFEETFCQLRELAAEQPLPLKSFLRTLSGKGKILVLVFLSLGFSQIPIIAIPLGFFISYLGIRIAMGENFIWVPRFLLDKKINSYFLEKIIVKILKGLNFMKRWSKPRYEKATQKDITRIINGIMIALIGLCISMCPPIPLVSLLASLSIFSIAIGLLNKDGVYIILGYIFSLLYFLAVVLLLNYFSFTDIYEWIKGFIS
jgi:hypothetical protein